MHMSVEAKTVTNFKENTKKIAKTTKETASN